MRNVLIYFGLKSMLEIMEENDETTLNYMDEVWNQMNSKEQNMAKRIIVSKKNKRKLWNDNRLIFGCAFGAVIGKIIVDISFLILGLK